MLTDKSMIKELKDYFRLFLLLMDFVASVGAFIMAAAMVYVFSYQPDTSIGFLSFFQDCSRLFTTDAGAYFSLILIPPAVLFVLEYFDNSKEGMGVFHKTLLHTGIAIGITSLMGFLWLSHLSSKIEKIGFLLAFLFILWFLLGLNRFLILWYIRLCDDKSNIIKRVLIVGINDAAIKLANWIDAKPETGLRVIGFMASDPADINRYYGRHKVTCVAGNFSEVLKDVAADCVLITPDPEYLPFIDQLFYRCQVEGIDFAYLSSRLPMKKKGIVMEKVGDFNLIMIKTIIHHPIKLAVKRLFDFFSTTIIIFILTPLWIFIPVLIKRDSKGPVFFRQVRIGKNGRRFIMYKFRSMVVDAEKYQFQLYHLNEMDGPAFKIKDDPRQTRVGRILRRTSLDELPQLFNVLKGDISLVGPRPPIYEEVREYRPWEKKRLSVAPGITCLWQISGRNNLKFDEWMKLDLMYIQSWSFAKDIKILLKTVPAVISREGAR